MSHDLSKSSLSVLCYTREPMEDILYATKLAYSMHLAYSEDGVKFQALNHNSGVLFARATDNEDGTMNAKSLKNPYLFKLADGNFGVVAVRTTADGQEDEESKGAVLVFTSLDLLQYEEVGLLDLKADTYVKDVACEFDAIKQTYVVSWSDEEGTWFKNEIVNLRQLNAATPPEPGVALVLSLPAAQDIEGLVPRNVITVNEEVGRRLVFKLTVPTHVANELPESITAASAEDVTAVKVKAIYTDGTKDSKKVDWDLSGIDWARPGTYPVTGTIHQDHFPFPVALNRADPCMIKWEGMYYFIATNDADSNHTLYIRKADSIPGLVEAEETLLLDSETYEAIKGLLWAPEFHVIEGELYIFHAATTGPFFNEESHVMKLRAGGSPDCAADWSEPRRVVKQDGSYLCEAGKVISLDMTVIRWNNAYYASWSERQFLPVDLGAWVYIAKLNPAEPWRLASDPVLLTKPDYGWANNHTFVDEGPFALIRNGRMFLTFASAAVDATYVVGVLTAEAGADLLDPASWTKGNYPLLTSRSVPGEFGPGHNSYVTDDDGVVWNAYHARPGVGGPRSSGIRRVHFDIDGCPVLALTEERDLSPELAQVSINVIVN